MTAAPAVNSPTRSLSTSSAKRIDLPQEIQEILRKPLPREAIGKHPRIEGLSSIKPAFVLERLNEAFGIGGWDDTVEVIDRSTRNETWGSGTPNQKQVILHVATVHLTFIVEKYRIHKENFGGNDNLDLGDALKGARTDALTKIASELGVGLDVYKSGRDTTAEEQLPPCPKCGGRLRRPKQSDGYFCWKAKGGCGANFTDDELKATQERQIQPGRQEPETGAQPRPAAPRNGSNGNRSGFPRQFALACKKAGKTDAEAARYLKSLGFDELTRVPSARYNELMKWARTAS